MINYKRHAYNQININTQNCEKKNIANMVKLRPKNTRDPLSQVPQFAINSLSLISPMGLASSHALHHE